MVRLVWPVRRMATRSGTLVRIGARSTAVERPIIGRLSRDSRQSPGARPGRRQAHQTGLELWLEQPFSRSLAASLNYSWQSEPEILDDPNPYLPAELGLPPPHRFKALLHESSLARTMPTDRILTCRCDTTLVGRGRSFDSRSHSRGRPHSPAQLGSGREGHLR